MGKESIVREKPESIKCTSQRKEGLGGGGGLEQQPSPGEAVVRQCLHRQVKHQRIHIETERNSTNKCIFSFSFLVGKHREPQSLI